MDWGVIVDNSVTAGLGLEAVTFALLAIGLNLHFGYTGLLNFGQAGFAAIGGYGVGVSVTYFDLPFFVGVLVGILAAIVLALLLGVPTLRLRADYLAIVTIAASEIIRISARSVSLREYTGGSDGINNFSAGFFDLNPYPRRRYEFGPLPITFDENRLWVITVGWVLVALFATLVWLLIRSPWGRVLKAIREDEDAARALGKNVTSYKMQALMLGGVAGALGGMVLTVGNGSIQADGFATALTFFAYTALILGGPARVLGPVVGSILFWFILAFTDNALRQAIGAGYIGFINDNQVGNVRLMLVGLGLMLLMIFRPQGLFGNRREIALDAR
jgi:neutral amino acid transport system permease protein